MKPLFSILLLVFAGIFQQEKKVIDDNKRGQSWTSKHFVKLGEEFAIRLFSDRTGEGYAWRYTDSSQFKEYLQYVGQTYKNLKNMPGSAGEQLLYFKAIRSGKAVVKLFYIDKFYTRLSDTLTKTYVIKVVGY
jgi:predicted secreted protein